MFAGKIWGKVSDYNTCFSKAAEDRTQLRFALGVEHIGAFNRYRKEYEKSVVEFFKSALSQ